MPLPHEESVENGTVMTVCMTCETKESRVLGSKPDLVDKFKDLALHPHLLKSSHAVKAAATITNTAVDVMNFRDKALFMDRNRVMEKVTSSDKIVSVDVYKVGSMDQDKILLTHLCGGFI